MEKICKTIKQKVMISNSDDGYKIHPDLSVNYNFKIYINSTYEDLGYFDVDESTITSHGIVTTYLVSGESISRLNELRKYKITTVFSEKYKSGGSWSVDGVDYVNSIENDTVVYYIGGIKYVDTYGDDNITTTYSFYSEGDKSDAITNAVYYKNPNMPEKIISRGKNDININVVRNSESIFDKLFYLKKINNMKELNLFLGGKYYKINNL